MAPSLPITFPILLLPLFFSLSHSSTLNSFIYGGCSQLRYSSDDSAYTSNLNSLLTSLVNSATYMSYNHFAVAGTSPHDVVYGIYQCRGDLSMPDCATCVANSVSRLGALCPGACGGVIQLEGCYVKYDNDTFIGAEDKTVVMKKCGTPTGIADKITNRDAVLDGVVGGGGEIYRAGGSKDVAVIAQCVGDLNEGQCQDCLQEADKQVKMVCATSGYGDMYLGKCYVRYTIGGGRAYFNTNNIGSDKNKSVKTFALIIGLLAAIVIVIIFLTFICRVFAGSSK
ncbi:plasmodesmata-located protein 7 [Beta vulgaris subsp. vulgaris]|uniref:plasmodesmata-located protein 7 n=1 Tax=Beta vulgaris subsp. vulgaris TaxID=3555 RepID=UPI002036CBC1|nr:plasmodesmata-located protein 7 [Beta vulgaris subsp. vulgaris]